MRLTKQATEELVKDIGREELFDEIRFIKNVVPQIAYPRYLKAVRVTLISLGFDEKWVETEFRDMLDERYFN